MFAISLIENSNNFFFKENIKNNLRVVVKKEVLMDRAANKGRK